VVAYELRRRGYDVEALPCVKVDGSPVKTPKDLWEDKYAPDEGWKLPYKNLGVEPIRKRTSSEVAAAISEKMAEWGDGTRAVVRVEWKVGGAHVFITEQANGKALFLEPQKNIEYPTMVFDYAKPTKTAIARVDGIAFDESAIGEIVKKGVE
jgi:hypothetical protein